MDSGTAGLYGDHRVESTDRSLKWLQVPVLVGEHTEAIAIHSKADTNVYVLLGGFEPRISLRLKRVLSKENIDGRLLLCLPA
jgi:hypothetical protein